MYSALFDKSPLLLYPLVALGIFIVVWTGAVLRAWRRRPDELAADARLALDDGEVRHGR